MLTLTKQERLVLLVCAAVLFIGSILHYAFKRVPKLMSIVNWIQTDQLYPKTNINRATFEELTAVPYIGPVTAKRILEYRQSKGAFKRLDDIKTLKGIRASNFAKMKKYITVQ
jgi:competence protein ComEA